MRLIVEIFTSVFISDVYRSATVNDGFEREYKCARDQTSDLTFDSHHFTDERKYDFFLQINCFTGNVFYMSKPHAF